MMLQGACDMTNGFTFIDLFAGIGGIRIPFEKLGGTCVFSSEWDKHARQTYAANFGETPAGDITQIDAADIPAHDILLAGFPCQPFSILGDKQGFADTRGTLFFDIARILKEKQPNAFLLENVKQLRTHDKGRTFAIIQESLAQLGYTIYHEVLNALDFGLPQKRERIFIVGFRETDCVRFSAGAPDLTYRCQKSLSPMRALNRVFLHPNTSAGRAVKSARLSRSIHQFGMKTRAATFRCYPFRVRCGQAHPTTIF